MLSLKCDHALLCEFPILFSTVKLKLEHQFSQLIHGFNIWILKCWSGAVYISKFFPIHKRWEIGIFEKPRLHFQIFPNSLKSLKIDIFDFCPLTFIFGQMVSEAEGGLSVRWHVVSERSQFMIKLAFFKKKMLIL